MEKLTEGWRLVVYNLESETYAYLTEDWDNSLPPSISWSHDLSTLYVTAHDHGRLKLFEVSVRDPPKIPKPVVTEYAVHAVAQIGKNLLLSQSSFTQPYVLTVYNSEQNLSYPLWSAWKESPLSRKSIREFAFKTLDHQLIHGFLHLPERFDETKKYPLAFLIHGGPAASWTDWWLVRWNSGVFANAGTGWAVAMINPTGSSGFGQNFQDAIIGHWSKPCTTSTFCLTN